VIIAQSVDAGILVVRAAVTPKQSVRGAVGKLQKPGDVPFGIVLNDVDTESRGSGYYRYQYYGRYETPAPDEQEGSSRAVP
jgi:Mrp family chromosome partitioning ATPase